VPRRAEIVVDSTDWAIVEELQKDCRLSFSELGRRVHMSSPAVAERVRRLEQSGVITGYHAQVDLSATGWAVLALVRMQCFGSRCILQHLETVTAWPNVQEVHRVTGDVCCELKVTAASMTDFEAVVDRLAEYGQPSSTLVLSSPQLRGVVRRPAG
jgi:Lrp/AsnC family transcriptional regulator, leucine-responsive regulatory protein